MRTYRFLWINLSVFFIFSLPAFAGDKALILAIHPYLPESEIQQRFMPFADYLAQEMGRPISIRVGGDYEQHITAIGKDQVDFAFLGPAAYVSVVETYGEKRLLARFELEGNPNLFGVIATRKDSSLKSLSELADKRFAFGDPQSTMSHIVPRFMLIEAGIPNGIPTGQQFLGSHKNVALGVLTGDYEAGAMKKEVFDEYEAKGLRALAVTPGVPDHLFVASNRLVEADVKKLKSSMLQLKNRANGTQILKSMHSKLSALVQADNREYDELRKMIHVVNEASN